MQRRRDGKVVFRDVVATVGIRVVDQPTVTLVVHPGLRIPTGSVAEGLVFTPLSTASLDPWLGIDAVVGADWLLVASAQAQVPLYEGWDGRRQGAYGRLDLQGARRVGAHGIVRAGVSGIGRLPDDRDQFAFHEVAAVGGVTGEVHPRVSLGASLRVPLWMGPTRAYDVGGGVNVTWVVGRPVGRERGEDEDDHHE